MEGLFCLKLWITWEILIGRKAKTIGKEQIYIGL
jgi:hypothetical protein